LGTDGRVWKIPRVWFYSDSVVHVRLLSEGLHDLRIKNQINVPWQVVLTRSDPDNPDTTFSLEPAPIHALEANIEDLRSDAATIADNLGKIMSGNAEALSRTV